MSAEVNTTNGFVAWWSGLKLRWKIALCAGGVFVLASALGDGPSGVPSEIEVGAVLSAVQLAGEKPLYHDEGITVTSMKGRWIEVRLGTEDSTRRWFNFDHIAAIKLKPDEI